jgi:PST family polysaccharide transporter
MGHQTFKTPNLAINFLILSGGEFLCKILTLVAFAYLARVLGPDAFGIVEFAIAVAFVFSLLVDGGFDKYGAVEVAKDRNLVIHFVASILTARFLLSLGAFVVLAILVSLMDKPWLVKQVVLLYGLTLFGIPGLLKWVFQAYDQMQWVAITSLVRQFIFTAGVFLFIRKPEQTWAVALIEVVATGSAVAFNLGLFRYYFGPLRFHFDVSFIHSLFRQTLPICLSQMMMALKLYLSTLFLGMLMDSKEVGWFGSAHRLVLALNTFGALYLFNLLPSIARCAHQPPETLHRLMGTSLQVTTWATGFLSTMVTLFAGQLIPIIYGTQYQQGIGVLQVLIWFVPVSLVSSHYRYVLIGLGQQNLDFLSTTLGTGVGAIFNLLLIPRYGSPGAAWTMLGSEVLTGILAYYFVRYKITPIPIWSHLLKPLLAGAIMIILLPLLPAFNFWIGCGTAVVLYGVVLLCLQPDLVTDIRTWTLGSR